MIAGIRACTIGAAAEQREENVKNKEDRDDLAKQAERAAACAALIIPLIRLEILIPVCTGGVIVIGAVRLLRAAILFAVLTAVEAERIERVVITLLALLLIGLTSLLLGALLLIGLRIFSEGHRPR